MTHKRLVTYGIAAALVLLALTSGCAALVNTWFPEDGSDAQTIAIGDRLTRSEASRRLGKPVAELQLGGVSYLRFQRWTIALQDERVVGAWRAGQSARRYDLTIDAMAADHAPGLVYIVPVSPVTRESLEFRELERHLSPILSDAGYAPTEVPEAAQYVVSVSFGIGQPKEWTETTYRPVFTYTPEQRTAFAASCPGCTTVQGSLTMQGQLRVDHVAESRRKISFERFLDLRAVDASDLREGREAAEVWNIRVRSAGPSDDLRMILPVMVAAAWTRIGTDTSHQQTVRYTDKTLRVLALKHFAGAPYNRVQEPDQATISPGH